MTITENQAKAIFKYIVSTLRCSDVKLSIDILMAKDIDSGSWFSVFFERNDGRYFFMDGNNYVSLLDKISKYKYIVISGDRKYRIPKSLEEILIEMDLNR